VAQIEQREHGCDDERIDDRDHRSAVVSLAQVREVTSELRGGLA
jgi:hypothetical protein